MLINSILIHFQFASAICLPSHRLFVFRTLHLTAAVGFIVGRNLHLNQAIFRQNNTLFGIVSTIIRVYLLRLTNVYYGFNRIIIDCYTEIPAFTQRTNGYQRVSNCTIIKKVMFPGKYSEKQKYKVYNQR